MITLTATPTLPTVHEEKAHVMVQMSFLNNDVIPKIEVEHPFK